MKMAEETHTTESETDATQPRVHKLRRGTVVSKSGNKSIVVEVERRTRHPKYGKVVRSRRKFHVHDENNKAEVGNKVSIVECRPVSRLKRWRLVGIEG